MAGARERLCCARDELATLRETASKMRGDALEAWNQSVAEQAKEDSAATFTAEHVDRAERERAERADAEWQVRTAEAEAEAEEQQSGFGGVGPRGVDDKLTEGGWKLERSSGGHRVYKRKVLIWGDEPQPQIRQQIITRASTPSDRRGWRNELAELNRHDSGVERVLMSDEANAGDLQPQYALYYEYQKELKDKRMEMEELELKIAKAESMMG